MQYIDNDMDDLFRKAAKDYPLNTNSGDWEEVVKKIAANDSERTIVPPVNKKNHKLFLLLLLLLPLAWLGHKYFNFHILTCAAGIAGQFSNI